MGDDESESEDELSDWTPAVAAIIDYEKVSDSKPEIKVTPHRPSIQLNVQRQPQIQANVPARPLVQAIEARGHSDRSLNPISKPSYLSSVQQPSSASNKAMQLAPTEEFNLSTRDSSYDQSSNTKSTSRRLSANQGLNFVLDQNTRLNSMSQISTQDQPSQKQYQQYTESAQDLTIQNSDRHDRALSHSATNASGQARKMYLKPELVSAMKRRPSNTSDEGATDTLIIGVNRIVNAINSRSSSFYNNIAGELPLRAEVIDHVRYYHERGGSKSILSKISSVDTPLDPNGQVDWPQFQLSANLMTAIGNAEKWHSNKVEKRASFWIKHGFVSVYDLKMICQKTWANIRLPDATKATIQKYLALTGI